MKIVISGDVSEIASSLLELRKLLYLSDQENYIPLASMVKNDWGEGKEKDSAENV